MTSSGLGTLNTPGTPAAPRSLPVNWLDWPLASLAQLAPIEPLNWPLAQSHGIELVIKREDLLDVYLGGNKFYKLYHHLKAAQAMGCQQIISFGGAFSNHLYALARIGQLLGIRVIGVVRGDAHVTLSPTLADAQTCGMLLHFVSRSDYRDKHNKEFRARLIARFGPSYLVPEGGGDATGARGMRDLAVALGHCSWPKDYAVSPTGELPVDVIVLPTGTGASLAGIVAGAKVKEVIGINSLKLSVNARETYRADILALRDQLVNEPLGDSPAAQPDWFVDDRFAFGGYGRYPPALANFVVDFEAMTQIPLDPVYGAKLFYAMAHKIQFEWPTGTRVMVLHTGGIQGKRGISQANNECYRF